MKITPIEIRQHTFEKSLRGYRVEDVDAFLSSLSQEWERVASESKLLKMQLELAEKELNKLKEVELTLFRTLKNAEDSSVQIAEQANRQAEQYLAETRQKADEQLNAAKKKSAVMVQDAENQARYVRENLSVELKSLEQDFKAMERYKDNLMVQIRSLAANAMESVDRFEKKFAKQAANQKFDDGADDHQLPAAAPVPSLEAPKAEPPAATTQATPDPAITNTPTADMGEAADELAVGTPVSGAADTGGADSNESVVNVPEPALPADAEIPANLPTNAQSTDEPNALAGADASAQYVAETPSTEPPVTQTESPDKKGGSFFDQI